MKKYIDAFIDAFLGTLDWTWNSIVFEVPFYTNYFWGLIIISLLVWGLEIAFPWRKNQAVFRQDFWLDGFYMFFNFFIFSIVIEGVYQVLKLSFNRINVDEKSPFVLHYGGLYEISKAEDICAKLCGWAIVQNLAQQKTPTIV